MPYVPFAPNNTARYWVKYTSGPFAHEIMFRAIKGATAAQMAGIAFAVCTAMKPLMYTGDSFASARYSPSDSYLSTPTGWTPIVGTAASLNTAGDPESFFLDWMGRDYTFGAMAHWTLFTRGNAVPPPASNRIYGTSSAAVQAVIDALNNQATTPPAVNRLVTISQGQPVIYPYANSGFNAYWQRRQRA